MVYGCDVASEWLFRSLLYFWQPDGWDENIPSYLPLKQFSFA